MDTYSCLQTKSIKPCAQREFMCTICQKKFENLHNNEKHQKHAHTPTLEQLTSHIAHTQNK